MPDQKNMTPGSTGQRIVAPGKTMPMLLDDIEEARVVAALAALKSTVGAVENRDAADALLYAQAYNALMGN